MENDWSVADFHNEDFCAKTPRAENFRTENSMLRIPTVADFHTLILSILNPLRLRFRHYHPS